MTGWILFAALAGFIVGLIIGFGLGVYGGTKRMEEKMKKEREE